MLALSAVLLPVEVHPYLAVSLNNLSDRFCEMEQQEEARTAYEEAVRILLPFFRASPAAFADRMRYMLRDYMAACRGAKREPDWELVKETLRVGFALARSSTVVRLAPLPAGGGGRGAGPGGAGGGFGGGGSPGGDAPAGGSAGAGGGPGAVAGGGAGSAGAAPGLALDAIDEQALTLVEGAVADEEVWALLQGLAKEEQGAE